MDEEFLKKEKKNVLKMHILFILCLPLFVIFFFVGLSLDSDEYKIKKYVKNNSEQLEQFVNGKIERDKIKEPYFFEKVIEDCNDETCFVEFTVDSYGIGSGTCYTGFYYSEKDIVHVFKFTDWVTKGRNLNSYTIEDRDPDSDNHVDIKKIKDNWYYYKECY